VRDSAGALSTLFSHEGGLVRPSAACSSVGTKPNFACTQHGSLIVKFHIKVYDAILHLQWLRTFLAETQLYRSPVTNIMADNQSAIAW
jgi:hypothetical protein